MKYEPFHPPANVFLTPSYIKLALMKQFLTALNNIQIFATKFSQSKQQAFLTDPKFENRWGMKLSEIGMSAWQLYIKATKKFLNTYYNL